MANFIHFFLSQQRLNYVLLIFVTILGVIGYNHMPKDIFPPIKLEKIIVTGGYPGTSIDVLDKMAVTKLEDDFRTITGVIKMESSIKNSRFKIVLTLEKGSNMDDRLNDVKDVISNVKRYFPTDMDEPIAKVAELNIPIISVVLSSDGKSIDDLIRIGKDIKKEFTKIEGVSNVNLYAENDRSIEIYLDTKKIEMLGLNKNLLIAQLKKFSYIYPAGKIEETGNHLFISTLNGDRTTEDILNIRLNVGGKIVYLKDIASIVKKYRSNDILTRFNGIPNVTIGIFKNEKGDAIAIAERVKEKIGELNRKYPNLHLDYYNDASQIVRNRLNTVISSIWFGIILVGVSVWILINGRVAFVVTIGVPTALLIGTYTIYIAGYAINLITLLGALLIVGVLVDDAVLVAENIQRYIKKGEDPFNSAFQGAKEVFYPVLASSVTTIFAFLPMFQLTGEMGEFLKMIPVAIISLVAASFLESFVFLPLHSLHTLKKDSRELDWTPVRTIYIRLLRFFISHGKILVPLFVMVTMSSTVLLFKSMKYQLFPEFDSSKFFIRGEFSVNYKVEEVAEKLRPIEEAILERKEELYIKSVSLLAGYKNTTIGGSEAKPNIFEFFIELEKRKPQNFIDEYITPLFAPKLDNEKGIRDLDVHVIADEVKKIVDKFKIEGLEEISIILDKPAVAKYDVEIQLSSPDIEKLLSGVNRVKDAISKMDGIIMLGDDAKEGIKELKIKPNRYGEDLGFTETYLAQALAPFFLEAEQGRGLGDEGIVIVITTAKDRDNFELLQNFEISTPDGSKMVLLKDVADLIIKKSFDSRFKENGIAVKTVYANVDNKHITAIDVLNNLQPIFKELQSQGIEIYLKGEQEQNQRLKKEMGLAFIIAMFLIFMTLLIMFNSFRATLMIIAVIPLSIIGAVVGHKIMGMNFAMPSVIGILGLAGVVINNGVVMLDFIRYSKNVDDLLERASLRLRPIIITSLTTFIGLSTLIFFATGQAVILQPIAVSLGYGLLWGTVLNLVFLPALYTVFNRKKLGM